MEDEFRSMSSNDVCDLVEIPDGAKKSRLQMGLQNEI
jgi:hypothetical protein